MAGRQAKILKDDHVEALRDYAWRSRYPLRNDAMVLLSVKAGLRAAEIANLTWPMIVSADGGIGASLELYDAAANRGSGRGVPLRDDLGEGLAQLHGEGLRNGPVIRAERGGGALLPVNVVHWFARAYRAIGLVGCSSHSGRRTFI